MTLQSAGQTNQMQLRACVGHDGDSCAGTVPAPPPMQRNHAALRLQMTPPPHPPSRRDCAPGIAGAADTSSLGAGIDSVSKYVRATIVSILEIRGFSRIDIVCRDLAIDEERSSEA